MIFDVMESVIGQNTDPSAEGKVVDASEGTLTLEVDGEQYTLETALKSTRMRPLHILAL